MDTSNSAPAVDDYVPLEQIYTGICIQVDGIIWCLQRAEREYIEYDLGCTSTELLFEKEYNFCIFDDLIFALK